MRRANSLALQMIRYSSPRGNYSSVATADSIQDYIETTITSELGFRHARYGWLGCATGIPSCLEEGGTGEEWSTCIPDSKSLHSQNRCSCSAHSSRCWYLAGIRSKGHTSANCTREVRTSPMEQERKLSLTVYWRLAFLFHGC